MVTVGSLTDTLSSETYEIERGYASFCKQEVGIMTVGLS